MSGRLNSSEYLVLHIPGNSHMDDVSGHGLDAEWQAGEAYVEGKNGRSVASFNGTTAYASFTAEQTDSFRFNGSTQDFSVSLWFKKATSAERGTLFDCRDASGDGYWLIVTDTSLHTRINSQDTSIVWANTNWHHVVMSADRDGLLWLYFDGAASDSVDISAQTLATTIGATIGRNSYNSVDYFAGNISDIRIYNMVLTQDEILELYRLGVPQQHVPELPLRQLPEITDTSLVAAFLNKRTQGGDDYSVNGNDGTPTDVEFGGRGGGFNGSSSEIAIPHVTIATALTYSMWYKHDGGDLQALLALRKTMLRIDDTNVVWYADTDEAPIVVAWTTGSSWHNIVVTQSGTNYILYVDNVVIGSGTTYTIDTGNSFDLIGNRNGWFFNGNIEDVRIYSEAKSANWVASEYSKGIPDSSLVLQTLVNDARDMSGNGNDGTPTDVVFGRGGEFNGTSSEIDLNKTLAELGVTNDVTVTAWVKTDTIAAGNGDVVVFDVAGVNRFYLLRNANEITVGLSSWNPTFINEVIIGTWQQWTMTLGGTTGTFYLNGIALGTQSGITVDLPLSNGFIGSSGAANFYDGNISNTRIYNEAKLADWVKQDYLETRKSY